MNYVTCSYKEYKICTPGDGVEEEEGGDTSYDSSSEEEEDSIEEGSDRELVKHDDQNPRYKKKGPRSVLKLGMKFSDKRDFKEAVRKHALDERKVINFVKDEGTRCRAKCDWASCPWVCLLSTSTRSDSWQINSFTDQHYCPPRRDNKLVTSRRIATKYENLIMANPQWPLLKMKATVKQEMFADVSISKLKRAKSIVMEKMFKNTKGEYGMVYDYQQEILKSNPGSTCIVKVEGSGDEPVFQRFYVCLAALKKGFKAGCRRVIGLDGCFFKGCTNGELLCAIGRDANNQMYPLAWAIVEKETNETWDWFCDIFFRDVEVGDGNGWVIISDQQKGIINAVRTWAPLAKHRNCARHVYANWRKKFKKKEYQKRWWRCAKSSCMAVFNYNKAGLAQYTQEGAKALVNSAPEHYCRVYFKPGSNCDSVDNNMCESFNKWIIDARSYSIISMLEGIRSKVMVRIHQQRTTSDRWSGQICPNIVKKLGFYTKLSAECHGIANGEDCYEVKHYDHRFVVKLEDKTCSCGYWQLAGLPCPHAIACILYKTNTLDDYVAGCFRIEEFKKTYDHCLQPLEGMTAWEDSGKPKPKPPGYVRMPGRPKKSRKREFGEVAKGKKVTKIGTRIRCSKCKGLGHNSSTCDRRHAASSQVPGQSPQRDDNPPRGPNSNAMVLVHTEAPSVSVTKKRQRASDSSACDVSTHNSAFMSSQQRNNEMEDQPIRCSARARVQTQSGGSGTINLDATVPTSQARSKVNVTVTLGTASAQVYAEEPQRKKLIPKRARKLPRLLMDFDT